MGKIHRLDDSLITKIAAGEVVEQPSSVVKELIENSIDAKATKITIEIMDSGFSLIKVKDNGEGMDRQDASLALERHATSKISSASDLYSIRTLGFRGEALASIAAVSKLRLKTKNHYSLEGSEIVAIAGKTIEKKNVVCPSGTEVCVEELFFNMPARKKFLKNPRREFSYILDVISNYALIRPEIHFLLVHNGKEVLNSPSTTNTYSNIVSVLGKDIAKELIPINYVSNRVEVMGYISKPSSTRSDRKFQSIFVNNRFVKSKVITEAIYEGYHTLLNVGRHPVVVLNVIIEPSGIDVNVHPAKTTIKIEDEDLLLNVISNSIKDALVSEKIIPEIVADDIKPISANLHLKPVAEKQVQLSVQITPNLPFTIIGKVHNTYIIGQDDHGIIIIDQHAVHERVLYEKYMAQLMNQKVEIQELLSPASIELSAKDAAVLENNLEQLKEFGFFVENFGKNTYLIRSIPRILGRQFDDKMILDILDELEGNVKTVDAIKEKIIIRIACRSAIKAHDDVDISSLASILSQSENADIPYTCPHGRPTMIKMSLRELEKKFKRIV